jgi:peptidoglycan/xylan/chitin deacetylase (PgdA/CDA1 family)
MKITRREFLRLGAAALALLTSSRSAAAPVRVPVLLYHAILPRPHEDYTVAPRDFAAQMEWLSGEGFQPVLLRELEGLSEREAAGAVVLTFDDGHVSFLDHAWPLLAEYRFKSAVNVVGRHVGGFLSHGNPCVSWDECRYLAGSGLVEVGCHSHDLHRRQAGLSKRSAVKALNEKLDQDLARFQRDYTAEMGTGADILAWPFGLYDDASVAIAQRAGFRHILTSDPGYFVSGGGLLRIPRLVVTNSMDLRAFRVLIRRGE